MQQSIPYLSGSDISDRVKFLAQVFGAKPADFVPRDMGGFMVTFSEPQERFIFSEEGLVLARLAYDDGQVGISATEYSSGTGEAKCFCFHLYQLGTSQRTLATVSYATTGNRTCRKLGIPTNNPLGFTSHQDARKWLDHMASFFSGIAQIIE